MSDNWKRYETNTLCDDVPNPGRLACKVDIVDSMSGTGPEIPEPQVSSLKPTLTFERPIHTSLPAFPTSRTGPRC